MPEACKQCAALERKLSEIKYAITAAIRGGHKHGPGLSEDGSRSLGTLLAFLAQTEAFYRSHRKVFHEKAWLK
jgi:hypothetical protein